MKDNDRVYFDSPIGWFEISGRSGSIPILASRLFGWQPPRDQTTTLAPGRNILMKDNDRVYFDSPIGWFEIYERSGSIASADWVDQPGSTNGNAPAYLADCLSQLQAYFRGDRSEFNLDYRSTGTEFQQEVWSQLTHIPAGTTLTYAKVATAIGREKAVRAVGHANGSNPISIFIPCHRVIGSNGKLTGYGGGLWRKEWLLEHEKQFR